MINYPYPFDRQIDKFPQNPETFSMQERQAIKEKWTKLYQKIIENNDKYNKLF